MCSARIIIILSFQKRPNMNEVTIVELRTLDAIMEDMRSIERDTDGLLDEIMK